MDLPFQLLPRASFAGVEFPVKAYRVRGGLRHHVHEYPHVPGGDLEKLGRKLYEIEFDCSFQATFPAWPAIWPGRLALLRSLFEAETTGTLVIPSIGPIQACALDWDQEFVSRVLTGEDAKFKFIEDQESAFAFQKLVKVEVGSLGSLGDKVRLEVERFDIPRTLFEQLFDIINAVLAIQDQADLYDDLLARKIGLIASLCRDIDRRIDNFQDPDHYPVLDALKDLWFAAQELAGAADEQASTFALFTVPQDMTIGQVSAAIYGDTTHATELLKLNPIQDALKVPAGTRVRYLRAPESAAA